MEEIINLIVQEEVNTKRKKIEAKYKALENTLKIIGDELRAKCELITRRINNCGYPGSKVYWTSYYFAKPDKETLDLISRMYGLVVEVKQEPNPSEYASDDEYYVMFTTKNKDEMREAWSEHQTKKRKKRKK